MRRVLVLVVCLGLSEKIRADTPDGGTDAPRAVVVLPADVAIADAKRLVGCEAERDELRKVVMPLWVPVVVGVLALGAGVGVGYAVAQARAK